MSPRHDIRKKQLPKVASPQRARAIKLTTLFHLLPSGTGTTLHYTFSDNPNATLGDLCDLTVAELVAMRKGRSFAFAEGRINMLKRLLAHYGLAFRPPPMAKSMPQQRRKKGK